MQVTDLNNEVTNVVVGNKKSSEFGISTDATFFNLLSTGLYSKPAEAVARETMCNAWDAHIEAGITDIPIEISFENDTMTIKDFGSGIADEDMNKIYCIYGASTKENDGNQTGGFGLGCKSPFAIADSFVVESCHNGVKTVYNLLKSSDTSPLPTLNKIISIPTEESGLTVKIPCKEDCYGTKEALQKAVEKISFFGDIKVKGYTRYLDIEKSNWGGVIVPCSIPEFSLFQYKDWVYVRYGNVVYSVDVNKLGLDEVSIKRIDMLTGYFVIFNAPPNSISITPSRESLHYSKNTVETLHELVTKFVEKISSHYYTDSLLFNDLHKEWIETSDVDDEKKLSSVMQTHHCIHNEIIYDENDICKYITCANYQDNQFPEKYYEVWIEHLRKVGRLDEHLLNSKVFNGKVVPDHSDDTKQVCREYVEKVFEEFKKSELFGIGNLYSITWHGDRYAKTSKIIADNQPDTFIREYIGGRAYSDLRRKKLYITTNINDLRENYKIKDTNFFLRVSAKDFKYIKNNFDTIKNDYVMELVIHHNKKLPKLKKEVMTSTKFVRIDLWYVYSGDDLVYKGKPSYENHKSLFGELCPYFLINRDYWNVVDHNRNQMFLKVLRKFDTSILTDISIAYSKREVVAAKEKGSINVLDNAKNILYDIMNSFMEEYRETASEILFYHQEMTQEEYNFLDEGLVNNLKESPALSYYREENYKFNLIYNTLKNFDKDYELPEMSETCKKTWEDYKNMDDEKVNRLAYIVNQLSGVKRGTRKYIIDLIKKEENL